VVDKPTRGRRALRERPARSGSGPGRGAAVLGGGVLLAGAAWLYLVGAAIEFGVLAVRGEGVAWVFALGASLGAVVCLVLVLALVDRGLRSFGLVSDYRPRRAASRRHR
jgi:hypothetical protein